MAKRIAVSTLNASTIDILNTIRANASYEYQNVIPVIDSEKDIPRVGELLMGYPALANQFINALVNRIALVEVRSANFNNAYKELKKGYLEFGETVEEVFVNIAKAQEFSVEKAAAREFKRTLPDVRSAFHEMNWRVMYPVTIQDVDLQRAFLSMNGVQDLIARIVDSIYTAAEYDEYLLFKYLLIKAIAHGKMYPIEIASGDMKNAAVAFRGTSNLLPFMSSEYNAAHVSTTTPKEDQIVIMSAQYNAQFDVEVLSAAFNMDRAEFMGRLYLMDDFTKFDNTRFDEIRRNSDQIDEVTDAELALMKNVKAIIVDKEWFQVYDNANKFIEDYVGAGLYWNYWYHTWKTVSSSPFSNAVVFVDDSADTDLPETVEFTLVGIDKGENTTVLTFEPTDKATLAHMSYNFVQTKNDTQAGTAVHRYGAVIIPKTITTYAPVLEIDGVTYNGTLINSIAEATAGTTITFTKQV